MNRKQYTGIGMGLAAAASLAILAGPTKNRRVKRTMKALGKVADELSGAMKFF